jgi:uncharacterized protein
MSLPGHRRSMRRAEKEITDPAQLSEILDKVSLLFLAFNDHPAPYVVPVCFAHAEGTLYVHSAREGTKIELLMKNPLVGFSASTELAVTAGPSPCEYGARGLSIVGTGSARLVEDAAERTRGMDLIMHHYAGAIPAAGFAYRPDSFSRTAIIAISIASLHGKRIGRVEAS